ncbi:MAG: response regulator [Pseudomonadota bacterium]
MARILVIDDDDLVLSMLGRVLENAGHVVTVASNGEVGIRLFREQPTDLIITDIIMPEKEGWETILELRGEFPHVKIIAISGGGRQGPYGYLMLAKRFGAERVFSKPLKSEELLNAISELLGSTDQ